MGDGKRPQRMLTSSQEGRKGRGGPEVKWDREANRVVKQTILNILNEGITMCFESNSVTEVYVSTV